MDDDEPTKREEMFDPTMRFILLLRPERLPVPVLASTATSEPGPSDHDTTAGDAPTSKSKKKKKKAEKVDFGQEELVGYCSFRFDTEETLDDERRVEVVYWCVGHMESRREMPHLRVLLAERRGVAICSTRRCSCGYTSYGPGICLTWL